MFLTKRGEEMKIGLIAWMFTAIFVTLKLTSHIDWSWWWVFAPVWGLTALIILLRIITVVTLLAWRKLDRKGFDTWRLQRDLEKLGERVMRGN
jgi:NADH:ubiquinone oxidoreductase subunit 6 (subunit J)